MVWCMTEENKDMAGAMIEDLTVDLFEESPIERNVEGRMTTRPTLRRQAMARARST